MASDTRNRILSVAARLFEAHGFEGTAVAAILREADVNSGSLYHFFPSKEALLVAVLEKYVSVLEPALLSAADRAADDPIEKVFALLELYRGRLLVSEFSRGCPIGDLSLEIGGQLPEARGLIDDYFEVWRNRVQGWFEDVGSGLAPDADRSALAAHVLAVLQGGIMQSRAASSIAPFDGAVSQLRVLLESVQADSMPREAARAGDGTVGRGVVDRVAVAAGGGPADGARTARESPAPGEAVGDDAAWWRAW